MTYTKLILTVDVISDWHIGSGEEGGAKADSLVLKDGQGLPYLPGRSLKGLLRDALQTAQDNQWFSSETLHRLLGSEGGELVSRGNLTVGSARLGEGERYFLSENKEAKKHLYRILYSTAIEHDTGVAKTTSLRSMEVAVPMTLHATLEIQNGTAEDIDAIKHAASLITHIGAKRHRGLGQSFVKVKEEALA